MTTDPEQAAGMQLRTRLLLCILFYGPAIFFAQDGDYVLAAVFAAAGFSAFTGYRAGALSIFALLAAMTAGIVLAPSVGLSLESRFTQWFGTTGLTNRFLSMGVAGLLITMLGTLILMLVFRRLLKQRPRFEKVNRWIGLGIGSVEGVVAVVFFLGGMLILEPVERKRTDVRPITDVRGRTISGLILGTSEQTRASRIGPAIVEFNPFKRIPQLNKLDEVQQSVQVLSDPVKIQGLLRHPSIQKLQRKPEVQRAVNRLNRDPEVQQVLQSGKPMDRAMAMTLLNHPAVMELVDQPGFLEEASQVIQETDLLKSAR